jgi:hypothetical protein
MKLLEKAAAVDQSDKIWRPDGFLKSAMVI